ncbi:MAG: sulfatase [Verrucomicrobia bacterium]|nr:sulfatase [Verrucomicrobiota bacterium]MDA1066847.1 sulfatase [Verrucomicrobiota bacterium]
MNFLSSLLVLFFAVSGYAAVGRPDILMIAIDDLRPMLGCYGDARAVTPNIDRLAARSVVFDRAYCQYAKCGPSRLSIMTGLRPDSIGVFSHGENDVAAFRNRRSDAISMARWFKDQGYHTQSFGKVDHDGWAIESDWSESIFAGREKEGLEIFDETNPGGPSIIADRLECPVKQSPDVADDYFFAGRMTNQVLAALHTRAEEKPQFIAVGFRKPHVPYIAPKRYFDLHQPDETWLAKNPMPATGSPVMAWFNSDGYVGSAKRIGLTMPDIPNHEEGIDWNGYEMRSYVGVPNEGAIPTSLQLELLQAYAACVSYVDAQVGRLMEELERSNRLDKTIILLWSDHGYHLGEQSAWTKMTNFEIATRVPLMIAAPGIKPGRTNTLSELVDLYPTLCDLAGIEAPKNLEGKTLVPVLEKPSKTFSSVALSQHVRFKERYMGRALRTDRYRFVLWEDSKTGQIVERELYDHNADPLETMNLAGNSNQQKRVEKLEKQLGEAYAYSK